MVVLCVVAVVGQAAGLRSLLQYGSEREGWNAQKEQFASVQAEWTQLSKQFRSEIAEMAKQKELLASELIKLEDDRKRLADDLGTVKGQYESLTQSRDDAIALQRRSQQQQQVALDAEQAAKARTVELAKEQATLEKDIAQLSVQRDSLQKVVTTNQATLDKQVAAIAKQTEDLDGLDSRVTKARDTLRKQNDDLLKASDELAKVLVSKQAALTAATGAVDEKDRVDKLNLAFTSLSGQVTALTKQRDELLVELSKEETRLVTAKSKLADYLEKWNSRESLIKDLETQMSQKQELETQVIALKAEQKTLHDLVGEKAGELAELRQKIENLRQEDVSLSASLNKKLKDLKAQPDVDTKTEDDSGQNSTSE